MLSSRKLAVVLLAVMVAALLGSTYFPNKFTISSPAGWEQLKADKPYLYELSKYLSTDELVKSWPFIGLSAFLFLSTLTCTVLRILQWMRLRKTEFEKEKAFSFSKEVSSDMPVDEARRTVLGRLSEKGWQYAEDGGGVQAQQGIALGFLGSILFHVGLICVFLAAPITALTSITASVVLTDGITEQSLRDVADGAGARQLPDVQITASGLWGKYYEGFYNVDFGGTLKIGDWEGPVLVNKPAYYDGFQFALTQYGYSPCVNAESGDETLMHACFKLDYDKGMMEPAGVLGPGMSMYLMFFPDFDREGGNLMSRGNEAKNPVLLIKLYRDGKALHKGFLLKPGEEGEFEGMRFSFPELRNWGGFMVTKEFGMVVVLIGSLFGIPGLLVRFLSNERRIEFEFREAGGGSKVLIRGYSRYYPAFLEKEVIETAELFDRERNK